MSLATLPASALIADLDRFDSVIDARSEAEYLLDRLPHAVNWPTLNDQERHSIGTLYQQVNAFEARKRGAALAARNIAAHIEREVLDKPKGWQPLIYCWRGGKRSGSLALVLDQIGFRVTLLEGGYKAFRAAVVQDTVQRVQSLDLRVICGSTGSGKTRLLQALAGAGAQVLDLEALANHRSSVLGAIPGLAQPGPKRFETLLWQALRQLQGGRPVFIESESRKIGNVAVPEALIQRMRGAVCLNLVLPDEQRIALLMQDYDYFVRNPEQFCDRLDALTEVRGKVVVRGWKEQVRAGNVETVVRELLTQHYDPVYLQSMRRNFLQFASAISIAPGTCGADDFGQIAAALLLPVAPPA